MATRIRLQRHGKKGKAFFHIVAADSRSKRDGKFIEKLGVYNPNTNPATIDINFDRTLHWVQTGAEMTDTARAILSYKGVLYKNHLVKGIAKGALTEAQVEERFGKWLNDKENKIQSKLSGLELSKEQERVARAKAEVEVAAQRAAAIEAKNSPAPEVVAEEEVTEAPVAEEAVVEEPATEEVVEAPVAEAPAAEEAAPEAETSEEESDKAE